MNKLFITLLFLSCFLLPASDMDFWSLSSNYADIPDDFGALMDSIVTMEQDKDNAVTNEITYDSTETRFERYDGSTYDLLDISEIGSTSEVTVEVICSAEVRVTAYPEAALVINENSLDRDFRVEGNGDANLFFADAGNDRVGIGTASPNCNLVVEGAEGTTSEIRAYRPGGSNWVSLFATDSGNQGVHTSGPAGVYAPILFTQKLSGDTAYTERMRIHSDGKVGIGTASPGELLEVNSATADAGIRVESGSGQSAYLKLAGNDGANNVWQLRATAGTTKQKGRRLNLIPKGLLGRTSIVNKKYRKGL